MRDLPEVEKWVMRTMEIQRIPGLAIAVLHEREVMYASGFGVTSVADGGIPVTPRTMFRMGSVI